MAFVPSHAVHRQNTGRKIHRTAARFNPASGLRPLIAGLALLGYTTAAPMAHTEPASPKASPTLTLRSFASNTALAEDSASSQSNSVMSLKKAALKEVPEPSSASLLALIGLLTLRRPKHR